VELENFDISRIMITTFYSMLTPKLRARAKITSHFKAPMHPAWLRCESLKYLDITALSRLAKQAPQHLKM
jgi:hypothetical protein